MAWFCDRECKFWKVRDDATGVHGRCKKYKRYVIYPTSVCSCSPEERIDNKSVEFDAQKPARVSPQRYALCVE